MWTMPHRIQIPSSGTVRYQLRIEREDRDAHLNQGNYTERIYRREHTLALDLTPEQARQVAEGKLLFMGQVWDVIEIKGPL